jgi:hypothetical protein
MTSLKYMTKKGEASVKKGGEGRHTRGPALCNAVNWPGKESRALCQRVENLPGRVLRWEDKGETVYIAVFENIALFGVETAQKILTEDMDQSAQWVCVVALSWLLLPLP